MVCVRLLKQHVHYSNYKRGWGESLDHSSRSLSLTPFSHSTNCLSAFVLFEKAETTETKCADFVPPKERENLREREWESECARDLQRALPANWNVKRRRIELQLSITDEANMKLGRERESDKCKCSAFFSFYRERASGGIPHLINSLQTIYTFNVFLLNQVSTEEMCQTMQSPQQFVYSLYTDIALTELKGYTMMEFSWMMLRVYGRGNFSQEAELMRRDYEKRTERTLKLLKEVMRRSDRILWRCDPPKHIPNVTYDEVTRLLQGYIENEVDLNTDETCRETCSYYQSTRSEGCFKELFCARQPRCSGRLYNCQYVDSDMWVCPSALSSTRRYEYIEYENGRVLGQRKACTRGTTKVDSWWRYLLWHCSYCFCLCDEQSLKSDRFFNLRESVSDVKQNK